LVEHEAKLALDLDNMVERGMERACVMQPWLSGNGLGA
jgi:hypothetical protein